MNEEIYYCSSCKASILGREFENGDAVALLGRRYCTRCKGPALKTISLEDVLAETPAAKRPSRPSSPLPTPPLWKAPDASRAPRTPPLLARPLFLLSAAVGGSLLVVTLLALFLPAKSPPPGGGVPPPPAPRETASNGTHAAAERELARLTAEIKDTISKDPDLRRYESVMEKIRQANTLAARAVPGALSDLQRLVSDYAEAYEKQADLLSAEITETANGLAHERRYDDALKVIDTFPPHLRHSRAWANLEGLRRRIENLRKEDPGRR